VSVLALRRDRHRPSQSDAASGAAVVPLVVVVEADVAVVVAAAAVVVVTADVTVAAAADGADDACCCDDTVHVAPHVHVARCTRGCRTLTSRGQGAVTGPASTPS
jgi:hypothetical protein